MKIAQQISVIATLNQSSFSWQELDKSRSPKIKCQLKGQLFQALIDTGAEINAVDKNLADSLCIGITATNESANQLPLEVCGQSKKPVEIECLTEMGPITLYLGIVLVIANLRTSCLIGGPGKKRNNIVCLPRHKPVVFASGDNVRYAPYDKDTANSLL